MKSLQIKILALVVIGSFSGSLAAQAQSGRLQYAEKQFELANFRLAAEEYAKIYERNKNYAAAKKAALSLDAIYAYDESYEWWKKAIGYANKATKEDFAALIRAGYSSVQNYDPTKDLSASSFSVVDFAEFSIPSNVANVPYRVYDFYGMDEFNSNSSDYSLSGPKSEMQYFASNRGAEVKNKKSGVRFDAKGSKFSRKYFNSDGKNYYSIYGKSADGEVRKVSVEGYKVYHLSDPQPLLNGKMIFTATPNKQKKRDKAIFPGVFYGTLDPVSGTVKDVKAFPYNRTSVFGVNSPRVDEEQKRLYFSSNRPGGRGGYDLYYVTWDSKMNFSSPVNLGSEINSPANERDGFRYENEFYFASDRIGGFGGLDVYSAVIQGNEFGIVSNLGQPINSTADDFGFIKYSTNEAYLASNRVGGNGYDDLYTVSWADRNLKIHILDQSGNSLKSGTNLYLIEGSSTSEISGKAESDVLKMVEKGNTYTFAASRPGYFKQEVTSTLSKDQEEITIMMTPIPYGLEVYETIIYYDLDKDFLRNESMVTLNEISTYMIRHPEISLVIESHTDSRASDSYNQKLSELRANTVTKYLEEKGINEKRVTSAWFGNLKLIFDCPDESDCPESNHQLNRRTELKLVIFPDQDKSYDLPKGATTADFQSSESISKWFLKKEN